MLLELQCPGTRVVSLKVKASGSRMHGKRARAIHEVRNGPPSAFRRVPEQLLWPAGCSLDNNTHAVSSGSDGSNGQGRAGQGRAEGLLTLDELGAVRAMGKLLLERVAAGSVGVRDWGLIDLGLLGRGVGVLVSHLVVVCWVAVDVFFPAAMVSSSSRWQREARQGGTAAADGGPPCFVAREALYCVWPLSELSPPRWWSDIRGVGLTAAPHFQGSPVDTANREAHLARPLPKRELGSNGQLDHLVSYIILSLSHATPGGNKTKKRLAGIL